jgi:hypothetical protein
MRAWPPAQLKPAAVSFSGLLASGPRTPKCIDERLRLVAGLGNDDSRNRPQVDEVVIVRLVDPTDRGKLELGSALGSLDKEMRAGEFQLGGTEARTVRPGVEAAVVTDVPPAIEPAVE